MLNYTIKHPRIILAGIMIFVMTLVSLAALPSIWPDKFPNLNPVAVDTDPENMLSKDEAVRIYHNQMKQEFKIDEIIVVGIINEKDENGVFNPKTLNDIYQVTQFAKTISWQDPTNKEKTVGVISYDMIAPSLVDSIESDNQGTIRFDLLMPEPPKTIEESLEIKRKAQRNSFLNGTLISENGKALCLYIPVTSKDVSYKVSSLLQNKIQELNSEADFHITGLPVANDTFGYQMFIQMAISAPLAMFVIFILMFIFFKKILLIFSPLMIAMASVMTTMSLLIITGNTIHIMSSMIAIFIMPIAVLDAVHILSEFFDRYPKSKDKNNTLRHVMKSLYWPMIYTSLTSIAGFASLALTPNPPVKVFGIFVAIGIFFAWLYTILLIPAYITLLPEKFLNFKHNTQANQKSLFHKLGSLSYNHFKAVILFVLIVGSIAVYGITKININDNPVNWFTKSHPIRIADHELNKHFAGTYMAHISFEGPSNLSESEKLKLYENSLEKLENNTSQFERIKNQVQKCSSLNEMSAWVQDQSDNAEEDADFDFWEKQQDKITDISLLDQTFKNPKILNYLDSLQTEISKHPMVGKVNSITTLIKTVSQEFHNSDPAYYKLPDNARKVAQYLMQFQSSHRPQDISHFLTSDSKKTNFWIQLKSGSNQDMQAVIKNVETFFEKNKPPLDIKHNWFGLNYINVIWQEKMVAGMLKAFAGSFLIVFTMMIFLFRSTRWAILSMVPLTITITTIYGIVGLVGKDYDMPIAVLSSLTLGLAVDFAIHFIARTQTLFKEGKNWNQALHILFEEPARAITRNTLVVAIGFTPLLFAPLMPYKTVGVFMAGILLLAGGTTLLILPALIRVFEKALIKARPFFHSKLNSSVLLITVLYTILLNFNFTETMSLKIHAITIITTLAFGLIIVQFNKKRKA